MARDVDLLLGDIAAAAEDAMRYASDLTQDGFELLPESDGDRYRALKNAVTELGEAVKRLPPELVSRHPDIDWRGLSGVRDIITHQYFRVDMRRLWPVVRDEFPELIKAVRTELSSLPQDKDSGGNPTPS